VELTNLNRQILHFEQDISRAKSVSAAEKLRQYNSDIEICEFSEMLTEKNLGEHLEDCSLVVTCVDNLPTRYLINEGCVKKGIAQVVGGVEGFSGYTLTVIPGMTPCFQCVFPYAKTKDVSSGVLGASAGVLGSLMALQAIKYLAGAEISSYFHYVDLSAYSITDIKADMVIDCPVCGGRRL